MSQIFTFGDFELDEARFELRRGGQPLVVQPKVLKLLLYLIEQRERAVSAEELLRVLWPETKVGAGSIKRAVMGARQALGERGESQSSIRTVRGHGYQFVQALHRPLPQALASPSIAVPTVRSEARSGSLVGREQVMSLLYARFDKALQGDSGCALLTGAPGIGKTRTAEELWAHARRHGAQVWLGRCTDVVGVPAFWPFTQVLRDALRDRGAEQVQRLMGRGAGEIAQTMPELRQLLPGLPEAPSLSLATGSARFRFMDSMSVFLAAAAERSPIVLGFDDLHHADPATLQLLAFLVRQAVRAPLLIVGTFRREPAGLPQPVEALLREDRTRCIELTGLDREALARYLTVATGASPPAAALDALQEQTAGNPLFVRQLVERWSSTAERVDWSALSCTSSGLDLSGAIERHLEVVPLACRELLRVASVLGREFSAALLARVDEQPIEPIWQLLSQAESMQLIEPVANEHGRLRFSHSLIREALYQQLPADDRARLHGRAGRALDAQGCGQSHVQLAEITRHLVRAAPTHDDTQALRYTLRAAETALARLAYEEAAAHFQCALQLSDYEAPDPARRMSLLYRKGDALSRMGELAAAREALFEALELARGLGSADMLFQAAALIAGRPEAGRVDQAQVVALRDAMNALPIHDERRVLLQAALAKSLAYASDRAERVRLARDALSRARSIADARLKSEILIRCHEALLGSEQLPERVQIAAELLDLAHAQGDPGALLRASAAQIETCLERGEMARVESVLSSMESLAERVHEPFFRWHAKSVRSTLALTHGDTQLAERQAREAAHYGAPLGEELVRHMYCTQVVGLFMIQGRMQEAEPLAREMAERYPGIPGWIARAAILDGLLGRREQAQRVHAEIMARGVDWICSEPFVLSGLCSAAELCSQVRDAGGAKQLYQALLPYADHIGVTYMGAATYGPITHYLGLMAAHAGDYALAAKHFEQSLESSTALRSPTFVALTAVAYAQLLAALGRSEQRARANALNTQARELSGRHGFHAVSAYCDWLDERFHLGSSQLQARTRVPGRAERSDA